MTHAKKLLRFAIGVSLCVVAGCGGDDDPAPLVAITSVSPTQLVVDDDLRDDLTVLLDYSDADGDLGTGVAEVFDCRADGVVVSLPLPAIASQEAIDAQVPIEGALELLVADVGLVQPDPAPPSACSDLEVPALADDQSVFCVYLTDAAGNTGPGDCTAPITIISTEP